MEEYKLTELLLRTSREVPERTAFCPREDQITTYFDGRLEEQVSSILVRHVAECRYCQAQLGNLARLQSNNQQTRAPGPVLADAKRLIKSFPPSRIRFSPTWAAAAVVVLAVSTIITLGPIPGSSPGLSRPATPAVSSVPRSIRAFDATAPVFSIGSPTDGTTINPDGLTIRWSEMPDTLHYEVRVVDLAGGIVWSERTEGTESHPPVDQFLQSGESYYVRVDAYLARAKTVSSDHVLITMEAVQP
jgi:hypothetical protein